MLANEAADALFWNIATKEDIDLAMTKGVNYPKGLLAWVDELGAAKAVEIIEDLREKYSEDRYRVSPILKEKAIKGEKFF
jgi:3-hydroxybutyryl-CoA dehydrogenase